MVGPIAEILSTPSSDEIFDSISMLYELSLGIGTSLDLEENCEFFVQRLMSLQNLSFVAIYADAALQGLPHQKLEAERKYCNIYTCPQISPNELEQIISVELLLEVQSQGRLSITTQDQRATVLPSAVHRVFPGIFSAFSVCQGEIIVILINQVRQSTYSNWQLSQLQLLLDKFGQSVKACSNHASLRQATQATLLLEKKLSQVQRLESLGLMASGLAHDLGNILNPLMAYSNSLESAFSKGTQENLMLSQIQRSAGDAHAMMQDLLMMTRQTKKTYDAIPLSLPILQYFSSSSFLSLQSEEPDINCSWDIESDSLILAENTMILRIIMNLVMNAFDALNGHGIVEIQVNDYDCLSPRKGYVTIPAGQYVVLTVKDNGMGIPESALVHIFEPFFSKKKLGRSGSGLGLAVVNNIVDGLDGIIDIQTGTEGTSFMLYFPRTAA